MELSEGQNKAIEAIKSGHNVFITGEAGTGKSYLIKALGKLIKNKKILKTSSTGISAINIFGQTIHRALGIWPNTNSAPQALNRLNEKQLEILDKSDAILIDEVSMISADFLEMINNVLKYFTQTQEKFGGKQIILVGDFLQLPPIPTKGNKKSGMYCFESEDWNKLDLILIKLKRNYRQNLKKLQDNSFSDLLNKMRNLKMTNADWEALENKCKVKRDLEGYIKLMPTNKEVDTINQYELEKLNGNSVYHNFFTEDNDKECAGWDSFIKESVEEFFMKSLYSKTVELKQNASVMMLSNEYIDYGIANGSMGKIVNFCEDNPVVHFNNGKTITIEPSTIPIRDPHDDDVILSVIKQIPLKLAWALTINKSQGLTLDKVYCDFTKMHPFNFSQGYVAISRCKTLENLYIKNFQRFKIRFNPKCIKFEQSL